MKMNGQTLMIRKYWYHRNESRPNQTTMILGTADITEKKDSKIFSRKHLSVSEF